MGKRIIQQARGKGSLTYRTKAKAFRVAVSYPNEEGEATILKLLNMPCYSAPIAKIKINNKIFYNIAAEGLHEGQKIIIGKSDVVASGNILPLKNIPIGTTVFCLETTPGVGPRLVRTSGLAARVVKKENESVAVQLPSKQEKLFDANVKATVGIVAASGRLEKPIVKAGKYFHMARAKGGRIYPRTSAVKMNAVDHPFGSGRGKRIKSKIAQANAPPGQKVGLLRPKKTGKKK